TELPAPTPAAPRPAPHKKSGPANAVAPGANAEDESFISARARALKKNLLDHAAADISNPPPPSQPPPVLQPPPHCPSPEDAGLPPRSVSPDSDKTPPPPSSQPRRPPTFPSDFEATRTAEQLAISWMRPQKCPISQEEVDKEDDQEFEEEIQVQLNPKGKKGKGKTSKADGPFKLGPVPDQAKERAFAIHAEFEKQIQDLAAEIGKAPQLLFSLVGEGPLPSRRAPNQWSTFEAWYGVNGEKKKSEDMSSQDWTKLLAEEHTKYCKDELGDKWKDPDAVAELFAPIVAWHKEKHGAYVDEMKVEGTFNKVVGKAQHEFMRL
ncbi:hypothetical protein DXG01_012976, partial [Tephrocybe rancida]